MEKAIIVWFSWDDDCQLKNEYNYIKIGKQHNTLPIIVSKFLQKLSVKRSSAPAERTETLLCNTASEIHLVS